MRLNPIVRKELQIGSRSIKYPIMIMIYNGILAVIALVVLYMANVYFNQGMGMDTSYILSIYPILISIQFAIISILIPIMTSGSIAGERERQTLDIMLTTKMSTRAIIRGKIFSVVQIIMMFIISSIPIIAIPFIYGGIQWYQLFLLIVVLFVQCILLGSIGVFCSVILKKTVVATIICFLFEGILYGGGFIILYLKYILFYVGYTSQGQFSSPSFGALPFLLLPNPATAVFQLEQHGIGGQGMELLYEISAGSSTYGTFVEHAWLPVSLAAQLLLAYVIYRFAAHLLSPIRNKRRK